MSRRSISVICEINRKQVIRALQRKVANDLGNVNRVVQDSKQVLPLVPQGHQVHLEAVIEDFRAGRFRVGKPDSVCPLFGLR